MKLKLTINIGVPDATRMNLANTLEGETVDVKPAVADELLKRGWGMDPAAYDAAAEAAAKGAPVRTIVPPAAPIATPESVDFDTMTKDELKSYADANKVAGVTPMMTKDEILKTVKKSAGA